MQSRSSIVCGTAKIDEDSAGSNTVTDHLEVLTAAINQIPACFRRDLLITCDGAGATKDLLKHITALNAAPGRRVHYLVGFDLDEPHRRPRQADPKARALAYLEARHRAHARVEDCIRNAKNTGLGHLPSKHHQLNQAWCIAAAIAAELLAWLRLLCLTGDLAKAEPKTLRYRLLHTAAGIIRGPRKRKIRIPETWPWANQLAAALTTALTLPMPA